MENPHIGILLIDAKALNEEEFLVESKIGNVIVKKDVFNEIFFPIRETERITESDLSDFIRLGKMSIVKLNSKSTMIECQLPTGFMEYETSSCVDKSTSRSDKNGQEFALKRIQSRLWDRFGFILQWAKYGLRRSK